jgi:hypothetical protein
MDVTGFSIIIDFKALREAQVVAHKTEISVT